MYFLPIYIWFSIHTQPWFDIIVLLIFRIWFPNSERTDYKINVYGLDIEYCSCRVYMSHSRAFWDDENTIKYVKKNQHNTPPPHTHRQTRVQLLRVFSQERPLCITAICLIFISSHPHSPSTRNLSFHTCHVLPPYCYPICHSLMLFNLLQLTFFNFFVLYQHICHMQKSGFVCSCISFHRCIFFYFFLFCGFLFLSFFCFYS